MPVAGVVDRRDEQAPGSRAEAVSAATRAGRVQTVIRRMMRRAQRIGVDRALGRDGSNRRTSRSIQRSRPAHRDLQAATGRVT
jgi:hypothetical protein